MENAADEFDSDRGRGSMAILYPQMSVSSHELEHLSRTAKVSSQPSEDRFGGRVSEFDILSDDQQYENAAEVVIAEYDFLRKDIYALVSTSAWATTSRILFGMRKCGPIRQES